MLIREFLAAEANVNVLIWLKSLKNSDLGKFIKGIYGVALKNYNLLTIMYQHTVINN